MHVYFCEIRVVISAILGAIPGVLYTLLFCFLFWSVFAILGTSLFVGRFGTCSADYKFKPDRFIAPTGDCYPNLCADSSRQSECDSVHAYRYWNQLSDVERAVSPIYCHYVTQNFNLYVVKIRILEV